MLMSVLSYFLQHEASSSYIQLTAVSLGMRLPVSTLYTQVLRHVISNMTEPFEVIPSTAIHQT